MILPHLGFSSMKYPNAVQNKRSPCEIPETLDNNFLSIFTQCSDCIDCIYILLFLTLVVLSLFSCFYPDSRLYGIDTCEYHS